MKILQIISGRNVNGAVTYCKFLTEQLEKFGHQVTIVCRPDGWLQGHLPPSVQIFESELNRGFGELQRVSQWIRQQNFDVMHTHMSRAHSFGVLMRMLTGTPVIATAHQCSLQLHWRFNDRVIANSHATAKYQRKINRVVAAKLSTIHCFTDLDRFLNVPPMAPLVVANEMRIRKSDFVIGVVGDILPRKGQIYLFQALPRILAQVPDCKLVLVGRFNRSEPYVRRLRRLQKQSPLLNRIKWLGLRNNVQDFMSSFDLCVVPSLQEPLGLVALESLATGTPVVASRTGGLPEIIQDGVSGLLVPPKRPDELADAIIAMAKDDVKRRAMGASGRRFVRENFCPDRLARQVESVYLKLAKDSAVEPPQSIISGQNNARKSA